MDIGTKRDVLVKKINFCVVFVSLSRRIETLTSSGAFVHALR